MWYIISRPTDVQYGGFPKEGVAFLGLSIIRIIIFGGLYWGPHIQGNYHTGVFHQEGDLNIDAQNARILTIGTPKEVRTPSFGKAPCEPQSKLLVSPLITPVNNRLYNPLLRSFDYSPV